MDYVYNCYPIDVLCIEQCWKVSQNACTSALNTSTLLYTTSYLHNAAATLMLLTYTRYTFVHMAVMDTLTVQIKAA